ncbi:MAG: hypothetical protein R3182_10125, partial [Draconibacterium sp.]|nr:hypothetical protein [Draconibacterium sp.]
IQYNDVLPTLLDVLGSKTNNDFDGSSFLSVLKGEKNTHREFAYFMHNNVPEGPSYPIRSVTDGEYHYIRNLTPDNLYIEKHLMGRMTQNQYWPSWIFESTNNNKTLELVTRYMKRPVEQIYNLDSDPNELNNLVSESVVQPILKKLSNELDVWMKQQGDPGAEIDTFKELNKARNGKHFEREVNN